MHNCTCTQNTGQHAEINWTLRCMLYNMLLFRVKSLKQNLNLQVDQSSWWIDLLLQWIKTVFCLLSLVCSAPESCTIMVHSFTNSSLELYYFSLSVSPLSLWLCVCSSRSTVEGTQENTMLPVPNTVQQHRGRMCKYYGAICELEAKVFTWGVFEVLRKEYATNLESPAVLENITGVLYV